MFLKLKKLLFVIVCNFLIYNTWAQPFPKDHLYGNIDSIQSFYWYDDSWQTTKYYVNNILDKRLATHNNEITSYECFKTDTLPDRILFRITKLGPVEVNNYHEFESILDSSKRIIEKKTWSYKCHIDKLNLLNKSFSFVYDNNNRVIAYKSMSYMCGDTLLQSLIETKYDEHSRKKEIVASSIIKDRVWENRPDGTRVVTEESLDSPRINSKTCYTYNENGLLVKDITLDYSYNRIKGKTKIAIETATNLYKYDKKGLLVKEKSIEHTYNENRTKMVWKRSITYYKYDSLNNCIQYLDKHKKLLGANKIFYKK